MGETMKQYTFQSLLPSELAAVYNLLQHAEAFSFEIPKERFNNLLEHGLIQLWVEPDPLTPVAVLVTEIRETVHEKYVMILGFAGHHNPDSDGYMLGVIKKWAVKNGCKRVDALCQDAQARLFGRLNFQKTGYQLITLELNDE